MMHQVCCPACYTSIDPRSSRCRFCHAVLERAPAGMVGVATGSICALMSAVKGYLCGAIVGAVVQVISGVSTIEMFAVACAVICGIEGYLRGSTRLRAGRPVSRENSMVTIYVGDKIQVFDLRN